MFDFSPRGLFDPVVCRKIKWSMAIIVIVKGRIKWREKNRVRVALLTPNPPHIHSTNDFPI